MKLKYSKFVIIALTFIGIISCAKIKKPDAAVEREKWIASFTDSVEHYQQESAIIDNQLSSLQNNMATQMAEFEFVKKPREVSGYYILKGWINKLPLTSTGIYARINENEKLELIATLGGATFNRLEVGGNYSEVVPHDQAFNFRHERYNTVYFSGGKADTIAEYISLYKNEKISLHFLEGNKNNKFQIPENEKDMISKTWNLYNSQLKVKNLQKELWLCSRKIDTFRRMMDQQEQKENINQ